MHFCANDKFSVVNIYNKYLELWKTEKQEQWYWYSKYEMIQIIPNNAEKNSNKTYHNVFQHLCQFYFQFNLC